MGIKTDREFLRNISVGAVGARKIREVLRKGNFRLIDTDRTALSAKIWQTKIKRLRVPDLLCLNSGIRIESRAKGKLGIIMSHSEKTEGRRWDDGLRAHDLVACIRCFSEGEVGWRPGEHVALFKVGDLRATRKYAKLSNPKAASEGSEVTLSWPSIVPNDPGRVTLVTREQIKVEYDSGRNYTYRLSRTQGTNTVRLYPHVKTEDTFGEGDRIIASVVREMVNPVCPSMGYDFLQDLRATERATVFCAAKALGHLPLVGTKSIPELTKVMTLREDSLVQLEAAGALARLGVRGGLDQLKKVIQDDTKPELQLEAALLVGELGSTESEAILIETAMRKSIPGEVRPAAVWGLGARHSAPALACLIEGVADADEETALHALISLSLQVSPGTIDHLLSVLGTNDRTSAGVVKAIQLSGVREVEKVVAKLKTAKGAAQSWLTYLLCCLGRDACESVLQKEMPTLLPQLDFFWRQHSENWLNRLHIADQLDFLRLQVNTA